MSGRTRLLRWGLPAVAAGLVLGATAPGALDGLAAAWTADRQSLVWLAERLLAFVSYLAITGSVVYGLLLSTRLLDAIAHRPINYTLHQDLAAVGVGMAAVHAMLLTLDRNVSFTLAQVVVPGASPYEPAAVAAGQLALYAAIAVTGSFYLRPRISQRTWRALHYLAFAAFAGATVHGLAAGSDAGAPWAQALYLGAGTTVAFLLAYRVVISVATRVGGAPPTRAQVELDRVRR